MKKYLLMPFVAMNNVWLLYYFSYKNVTQRKIGEDIIKLYEYKFGCRALIRTITEKFPPNRKHYYYLNENGKWSQIHHLERDMDRLIKDYPSSLFIHIFESEAEILEVASKETKLKLVEQNLIKE